MVLIHARLRCALMALVLTVWGGVDAGAAENAQSGSIPRPAREKLVGVLSEVARAQPSPTPVSSVLRTAPPAFSLESMPKSVRDAVATRLMRLNARGEIQVYVAMNPVTDARLKELAAHGVTIEIADEPGHRVQARIPAAKLEEVAGLAFVDHIRLPSYAFRMTGSVSTEGDAIMRSDLARAQLGLTGAGVKVGVISDGIKGIFATGCTTCGGVTGGPISTGDLPTSTGTRNISGVLTSSSGGINGRAFASDGDLEGITPGCSFAGAGAEGTALLEIVHDIAPNAQLSFANADTDVAMNQAVNFLAASNDVVVDDLGFYGLPSDGTSSVSQNTAAALNSSTNRIRGYYTSAGNGAANHYFGAYANSGVSSSSVSSDITNSGNVHLFAASPDTTDVLGLGARNYNLIRLPAGGQVYVILTWDDPDGFSTNNYDLYLVRDSTHKVVDQSTDVQSLTRSPREIIGYTNDTGVEDLFEIVIQNVGNAAQVKNLNLFVLTPQCAAAGVKLISPPNHARLNYVTPTRSLSAQSDAGGSPVSVVSVGAICSASQRTQDLFAGSAAPFESCYDTTHSTLEHFSAQGPTIDGRLKPDVTGIDGVSVTGAGNFVDPFFGTSASAPHAAGLAALALESAPCLIAGKSGALSNTTARTNLRNLILDNAVPLGGAVPNDSFGYGRADALSSVQASLPTFGGIATLVVNGTSLAGTTLTPAQLGFGDPNSCPLTTLNWSGGCGTGPSATLACPLGASNVSVSASNNAVSFSSPASVQIIVTDFAVAGLPVSQTVTAGDAAVYTITASAQYGAFTNPVALACSGLPAETSCSFNPPTVTPGASSSTSTLTISTTPHPPAAGSLWMIPHTRMKPPELLLWIAGVILIALLVMARTSRGRQKLTLAVLFSAALVLIGIQLACGGGGGGTPPAPTPSARLSSASLNFGSQLMNTTSASQPVTLSNSGSAALSISSIAASGDFAQSNNCGSSLAAGSNCKIDVTFKPTAAGTRNGSLTVTDNASGSPHTASLSGIGLAGTAAGNYPITITGSSGSLARSANITLLVQ